MASSFAGSVVRENIAAHFEDIKQMRASLSVSDDGRLHAQAIVATVPDLQEGLLWTEYVNDTIEEWLGDQSLRARAPRTPAEADAAYLEWLKERVLEPFRLSPRVVRQVCEQQGAELGMHLAIVGWDQEIAWAHRLRRDGDATTAVLAGAALMEARRDPSRVFAGLADVMGLVEDDLGFLAAPQRLLQAEQIRLGTNAPEFRPLILRWAEREIGPRLHDIPGEHLELMAQKSRDDEDRQLASFIQSRVLTAIEDRPLRRWAGIIREAIQIGMTSDDLALAEEKFVEAIKAGKLIIPAEVRLPYTQFIHFLRLTNAKAKENRATAAARRREFRQILGAPSKWISHRLPPEFIEFGAKSSDYFGAWSTPIVEGKLPPPEDPIVDYCMFLLRLSMARPS